MQATNNPKQTIKILRLIYFSLLIGILAFLAISINMTGSEWVSGFNPDEPLFLALIILSIIIIPVGYMVSGKHFRKGEKTNDLPSKIEAYQTGLIIRLAVCEGVSLFSIVTFLVTANVLALIFLVLSLGIMAMNVPSLQKMIQFVHPGPEDIGKFS